MIWFILKKNILYIRNNHIYIYSSYARGQGVFSAPLLLCFCYDAAFQGPSRPSHNCSLGSRLRSLVQRL